MNPSCDVEGFSLWYLHSSVATLKRLTSEGDLQSKFLFKSGLQCAFHQLAHHHFQLSVSSIRPDSIILQVLVKNTHIEEHGKEATNGWCKSMSIQTLPISQLIVTGAIILSPSLAEWLTSAEGINLTRPSVSHFESFYQASRMSELRILSPECLLALGTSTPHSNKVHSTLNHQVPEFYSEVMAIIEAIK
eukprot:2667134-Amphidinium_carterae.1